MEQETTECMWGTEPQQPCYMYGKHLTVKTGQKTSRWAYSFYVCMPPSLLQTTMFTSPISQFYTSLQLQFMDWFNYYL